MSSSYSEGAPTVNLHSEFSLEPTKIRFLDKASTSTLGTCKKSEGGGHLLVNRFISQHPSKIPRSFPLDLVGFKPYKTAIAVKKDFQYPTSEKLEIALRGKVEAFSFASRKRLKFAVQNSVVPLVSQFCCTYHENPPMDGELLKKDLNSFLTRIRTKLKIKHYLWILEFQKPRVIKGKLQSPPHFHIFLPVLPTREIHLYLSNTWNRLTKETKQHLEVHSHSNNFIEWNMGSGSYLCKYLEKEEQKNVPEEFEDCGRFWGHSRGLVPDPPVQFSKDIMKDYPPTIDLSTGELPKKSDPVKYIYRCLRKHHENRVRETHKAIHGKKRRFKSQITRETNCMLPFGGLIYDQLLNYLAEHHPTLPF